jgi:hypothetical protein
MARLAPWAVAVLAVAIALAVIFAALRREAAANAQRDTETERQRLIADHQIVALQTDKAGLEAAVRVAVQGQLATAIEAAKKAAPGARVVRVMQASTGPVQVQPGASMATVVQPPECPPVPACALAPGDTAEARVSEVDLQTKAGNQAVVGTAECWRLTPEPAVKLFGGPFEARLTTVTELEPIPDNRWVWWQHELIGAGVGAAAMLVLTR